MTFARAGLLLGQFAHVFKSSFWPKDLQHAGKPIGLGAFHQQLAFPFAIEQVGIRLGQLTRWYEAGVVSGHVGVVIDRRPKAVFFKILGVQTIRLRNVTRQNSAAVEYMHAEFDGLDDIRKRFFGAELGQDSGQQLFTTGAVQSDFDKRIALFELANDGIGFG
jgi:hypothetical protein